MTATDAEHPRVPAHRGGRRPVSAGAFYTLIALVFLLAIGAFTLTTSQHPPPTVAEFSPQAIDQIEDAPEEQTSDFGAELEGLGEGEVDTLEEVPSPPPVDPVEVPRIHRCVGDPPRQIEDPHSPPCVPYWEGENPGATWQGVTTDEIRIAVPWEEKSGSDTELTPELKALETFFNSRFEFYGRRLRLLRGPPSTYSQEPEEMRANAVHADEQLRVFASLPHAESGGGNEYVYNEELARRGIVSTLSGWAPNVDDEYLAGFFPYIWSYHPGSGEIGRHVADWICRQLAGGTAEHAGGLEQGQDRVFGLLTGASDPDVEPFRAGMDACGVKVAHEGMQGSLASAENQTLMLQFRDAGVTSIVSLVHWVALTTGPMPAASSQGYQPEWILSSYGLQMADVVGQVAPRDQWAHTFGLDFLNKMLPREDRPVTWAYQEVDPTLSGGADYWVDNAYAYWPLLILSSGIQMAGPNLTPDTFGDGLLRTTFPNPNEGKPPYYQAAVGFEWDDYSFLSDATLKWWHPTERSLENDQPGAFCYAEHGRRHRLGEWPSEEPELFAGPCY